MIHRLLERVSDGIFPSDFMITISEIIKEISRYIFSSNFLIRARASSSLEEKSFC
jgi:hypothetical protein